MANPIRFRRGERAQLPLLRPGEPALCVDTGEVFVGGSGGQNLRLETAPDYELIALEHRLDAYPHVLALCYQYGAGIGGAGETPAGGENAVSIPVRVEYLDRGNLKIYTQKSVAALGKLKTVEQISEREYVIVTDDSPDNVYIRLILT